MFMWFSYACIRTKRQMKLHLHAPLCSSFWEDWIHMLGKWSCLALHFGFCAMLQQQQQQQQERATRGCTRESLAEREAHRNNGEHQYWHWTPKELNEPKPLLRDSVIKGPHIYLTSSSNNQQNHNTKTWASGLHVAFVLSAHSSCNLLRHVLPSSSIFAHQWVASGMVWRTSGRTVNS